MNRLISLIVSNLIMCEDVIFQMKYAGEDSTYFFYFFPSKKKMKKKKLTQQIHQSKFILTQSDEGFS